MLSDSAVLTVDQWFLGLSFHTVINLTIKELVYNHQFSHGLVRLHSKSSSL